MSSRSDLPVAIPAGGLSEEAVLASREDHGPNELPEARSSLWRVALRQLDSVLVWILVGALVLSVFIGSLEHGDGLGPYVDAMVIGVILVLNFAFGFAQEFAAERAISALRRLSAPSALVRRGGAVRRVPAREVVVGDLVVLEAGDMVPADGTVLCCAHLRVDESALTGESVEVAKEVGGGAAKAGAVEVSLADRRDRLFSSTLLTRGSAEMLVTAVGLQTEVGRIAEAMTETETPPTPLQKRLARLGQVLGLSVLGMAAVVVGVGVLRGQPFLDMLLVGVSLAVSAVPEGLPAVVTVCFALGVRHMARDRALVRRLDSLETLGAVTTICTDKTGTLTENRMSVVRTWTADPDDSELLAQIAASCNRAELPEAGEPTELALLRSAESVERLGIEEEEIPFTSESRCMQTRHGSRSFLKGAPEVVAERCGGPGGEELLAQAEQLADEGLRVLAAAVVEGGVTRPVGLWGMSDPPREGVADAIAAARRAGVRSVMITGDAPRTARAIAREVGLEHDRVLTGADLDRLEEPARTEQICQTTVFARVEPLHKLEILRTLQEAGEVVAMTGDGVNDAPALRGAHVGVAMGQRGTEVARGAASIVLADDHYATIVGAIAEGRRIHDNIRRFVLYMLRANFNELLLVLASFVLALPLPLLPVHILWINLLTEGPPALALAAEGPEPDLMDRPPRPRGSGLLEGEMVRLFFSAAVCFAILLGYYQQVLGEGASIEVARTGTLTLTVLLELLLAWSSRTQGLLVRSRPFDNLWLVGATGLVASLHLILVYSPLANAFHLVALPAAEWGRLVVLALMGLAIIELAKLGRRTLR